MQSNLAPAVTPRPVKHQNNHAATTGNKGGASPRALLAMGAPSPGGTGRGGRTYTPSAAASPIKPSNALDVHMVRPPESTSTSTGSASSGSQLKGGFRKKPLVVAGDIRNLGSNFHLSMSKTPVAIHEIVHVFQKYEIAISNDDALALSHEYEENNDRGLLYEPFVDELVQLIRQTTSMNASGSARLQAKKTRLAVHCHKLSTMLSKLLDELMGSLRDKLKVPWTSVRDAFRKAEAVAAVGGKNTAGTLSKAEFMRICKSLEIPVSSALVDAFAVRSDDGFGGAGGASTSSSNAVDYTAFLTHFGSAFQHGDTNSVGFSLIHSRPLGGLVADPSASSSPPTSPVNHTLHSPGVTHALHSKQQAKKNTTITPRTASAADPVYMERLRILLTDKIVARYSDVKRAFVALDKDGNGVISTSEFESLLQEFHLIVSRDEFDALVAIFDTNNDGRVDYNEFFAQFGQVQTPVVLDSTNHKLLLENSSLVFGGERDIKGANKNRMALSSPGNDLKEALSRLSDAMWRAMYVEWSHSDLKKTGVVPSAELLRVLGKYLGDGDGESGVALAKQHYASLFRACGSHVNQLMNYRQLVKSYRPQVMDPVEYFHQDTHAQTDSKFRKSPTESLVMVWSIRVQRLQMKNSDFVAMKEELWKADLRRVGRITATQFAPIVKSRMALTEDQAAFLCFFYEDTNWTSDHVSIRYGSFLTDYEDSGLEETSSTDGDGGPPGSAASGASHRKHHHSPQRVEGKGRVRPPGYGIHNSHHHAGPGVDSVLVEQEQDEKRLSQFLALHIRSLEAQVQEWDPEKRGFVPVDQFISLCKKLSSSSSSTNTFRENSKAFTTLLAKYVAQHHFYYRGFLLDFDTNAGLQSTALMVQDDEADADEGDGNAGPMAMSGDDQCGSSMDVYQAKEALRHHLTVSLSRQKVVYKALQRMDPGKTGLLGYAELRRALERLDIPVDDSVGHALCGNYEDEDEADGAKTGRIKYLLLLHAYGGRDPDSVDGMSDLSSNCSYYSAISISPRAVMKKAGGQQQPRSLASRDAHAVAARAVANAIEKPLNSPSKLNGAAAASAVEKKIQSQLDSQGNSKKNKWKALSRAFQQIDLERKGAVSAISFRKVMEDAGGVRLDQEDVLRLQLKYDVEQNGRLNYLEFLRNLTNSMSDLPAIHEENSTTFGGGSNTLPTIASPRNKPSATKKPAAVGAQLVGMPEPLRQGVKAKWKAIYASLKTLDKTNIGRVTSAHFRHLLEWYALSVTDDEFLQLLRLFDHSEDGGVDYNKFMKACFA